MLYLMRCVCSYVNGPIQKGQIWGETFTCVVTMNSSWWTGHRLFLVTWLACVRKFQNFTWVLHAPILSLCDHPRVLLVCCLWVGFRATVRTSSLLTSLLNIPFKISWLFCNANVAHGEKLLQSLKIFWLTIRKAALCSCDWYVVC